VIDVIGTAAASLAGPPVAVQDLRADVPPLPRRPVPAPAAPAVLAAVYQGTAAAQAVVAAPRPHDGTRPFLAGEAATRRVCDVVPRAYGESRRPPGVFGRAERSGSLDGTVPSSPENRLASASGCAAQILKILPRPCGAARATRRSRTPERRLRARHDTAIHVGSMSWWLAVGYAAFIVVGSLP
jgi:hypothetical protein